MKNLKLLLLVLLITTVSNAQSKYFSTGLPNDFVSVSLQLDLFGSIDKQGFNGVAAFQAVDFGFLEYEVQSQFIVNEAGLDYIDLQLGVGYMIGISETVAITPGVHWGLLHRPLTGLSGVTYGVTLKGRIWIGTSKRFAFVVSSSYDRRPDIEDKWGVLNGRAGFELRLN